MKLLLDQVVVIQQYGEHLDKLTYGLEEKFKRVKVDEYGRFIEDANLKDFIDYYIDEANFAIFILVMRLKRNDPLDRETLWEKDEGKYCKDSMKDYIVQLLYLSKTLVGLAKDLKGIPFTKRDVLVFINELEEITAIYQEVCYRKIFKYRKSLKETRGSYYFFDA